MCTFQLEGSFVQYAQTLLKRVIVLIIWMILQDGNTDIEEAEVQEDEDVTFHSASTISELNSSIKELAPTISPFKFQLQSAVDLVAPSTERYLKRKLDSCVEVVTDFLRESIAPGQGKEVKKRLLESSQEESS